MLSFSLFLQEAEAVTNKDVGEGLGGLVGIGIGTPIGKILGSILGKKMSILGGGLGAAAGGLSGRVIGGKVVDDPEGLADFENALDRIGYLGRPYTSLPASAVSALGLPGLATFGAGGYNAVGKDVGADRIGYDTEGKIGAGIFGPIAGIFAPDKIRSTSAFG